MFCCRQSAVDLIGSNCKTVLPNFRSCVTRRKFLTTKQHNKSLCWKTSAAQNHKKSIKNKVTTLNRCDVAMLRRNQLIKLLFVFVCFYLVSMAAPVSNASPRRAHERRYCGRQLVDVLRDYCGSRGIRGPPRRHRSRGRRGITNLCCHRLCSSEILERFCNPVGTMGGRRRIHPRFPVQKQQATIPPSGDPDTSTHNLQPTSPPFRFRGSSRNEGASGDEEHDASYHNFIRELWKAAAILHGNSPGGSGASVSEREQDHSGRVLSAHFEPITKKRKVFI